MGYACRTGTKRNLDLLRARGWRLLVSARGVLRNEGFRYALDNGAWTSHAKGEPFDVSAFERAVDLMGELADFIVAPDIVEGGLRSLEMSLEWLPRLAWHPQVLIPLQDGMSDDDLAPHVGPRVGLFLGGSTAWKLRTMSRWGHFARRHGCYYHVGRVNTVRRVRQCVDSGAHSFDGSGPAMFAAVIPKLDNARRQLGLWEVL